MLKILRDRKNAKKIWIALTTVIIVTFAFWGTGYMRNSKDGEYSGKIFGRLIPKLEYQEALLATRNQALMQFGDKLNEMLPYLNLEGQAWERLILLHEADKRSIRASDEEVISTIQKYPFFARSGKFDEKTYAEVLRYVLHSQPRQYEEQVRQNIILSKLFASITKDISASDQDIRDEFLKGTQEVSLFYIASLPAEFAKSIIPTDQEIKEYFDRDPNAFKQPLSFNLEYLTFPTEESVVNATELALKKTSLKEIAAKFNLTIKETGLFAQTDPIPEIGWAPQILTLVGKSKQNEIFPPLKIDKVYYLMQVKERKEAYIPDFEKAKDKVKEAYIKNKSTDLAKMRIDDCQTKLKNQYEQNPKTVEFEKCAKEFGLKTDSTALFKHGSYIEGIGSSDIFWLVANKLKEDEISPVITLQNGFYICKLKSKTPFDDKKFEESKLEFKEKLLLSKKQEFFATYTRELVQKSQQ